MISDAECIRIISEVLSDLKLGKFVIKVSYIALECWGVWGKYAVFC